MNENIQRRLVLAAARKIVIKIGTGVLTRKEGGIDLDCIEELCRQVHELGERGVRVIVVTSGSIGTGMHALGLKRRPKLLPELQAVASVGQNHLMIAYENALNRHGRHAGQILLTREDLNDRRRFVNAANTIRQLLRMGVVPIVNENDSVSTDEIRFGGNDELAAQVMHALKADALVFLSNVDGLLDAEGRLIDVVDKVTVDTLQLDTGEKSALGIGGMHTKLRRIQEITDSGDPVVLVNGKTPNIIVRAMSGEAVGTLFCPAPKRLAGRKRWLSFSAKACGTISIDDGAMQALVVHKKSLLASGVRSIEGQFSQGDIVAVAGPEQQIVARGITNYSSAELDAIKGAKTSQIESLLGYKFYDEVIHRDNLVTLD